RRKPLAEACYEGLLRCARVVLELTVRSHKLLRARAGAYRALARPGRALRALVRHLHALGVHPVVAHWEEAANTRVHVVLGRQLLHDGVLAKGRTVALRAAHVVDERAGEVVGGKRLAAATVLLFERRIRDLPPLVVAANEGVAGDAHVVVVDEVLAAAVEQ